MLHLLWCNTVGSKCWTRTKSQNVRFKYIEIYQVQQTHRSFELLFWLSLYFCMFNMLHNKRVHSICHVVTGQSEQSRQNRKVFNGSVHSVWEAVSEQVWSFLFLLYIQTRYNYWLLPLQQTHYHYFCCMIQLTFYSTVQRCCCKLKGHSSVFTDQIQLIGHGEHY